jgi:hypothetical protein
MEHRFNATMIADLRNLGVRAPLVTTSTWGGCALSSLPALTEGDVIDVHSYGEAEELSKNPRYQPNLLSWIGAARVVGKPISITEYNVVNDVVDRFTLPLYTASIAALQGWDMPMIYAYSQGPLKQRPNSSWSKIDPFSTDLDPRISGIMPAAAVAFRRGHISPARTSHCLMLTREQLLDEDLTPITAAALRTILEQSRFSIGIPAIKELPWLKPSETPAGAIIVNDPYHDFIPPGQSFVRSDTGELLRSWKFGIQQINSPKTQSVSGWIGGKLLKTADATFHFTTKKATVALTSLDDKPLAASAAILVTAVARAVPSKDGEFPYLSEPVVGEITLKSQAAGLELLALSSSGSVLEKVTPESTADGLSVRLPTRRGTHWYVLKSAAPGQE